MTAHTPGPWNATAAAPNHSGIAYGIFDPASREVAMIPKALSVPEQHANARLIAAAPDMLAVLKEAERVAIIHKLPQFESRVRAAIAKAESAS